MTTSTPKPNAPLRLRYIPLAAVAALSLMPSAANADIDNTANATGTYNSGTITSNNDSEAVDVTNAAPSLDIAKSVLSGPTTALGANATQTDALDTITFRYIVTNNGNVTMTGVVPVDAQPTFNGTNGTNTFPAFTPVASLAPGASVAFTGVYTLSLTDVRLAADITNGVKNTATVQGTPSSGGGQQTFGPSNEAQTTINGYGALTMLKTASLVDTDPDGAGPLLPNGTADVGETITYTYKVTNTGTGTVTGVQPRDWHETTVGTPVGGNVASGAGGIRSETVLAGDVGPLGAAASTDATANNGVWSTLAAGAAVTMTYSHVVTTTEYNNQ
jgi:uncharacterized repeat protein (TIGR01451 family)